jgi:hypothetical protein
MKQFLIQLINQVFSQFEDNPTGFVGFVAVIIIVMASPAEKLLSLFLPELISRVIVVDCFLLLLGIMGILMVKRKEAPIFIVSVRGTPAVIIGVFMIIVSSVSIAWSFIFNFVTN